MASEQPGRRASNSESASRSALPAGTRLIWGVALLAIVGSIGMRVRHTRMLTAASANPRVDMHEADLFVEDGLAALPPARREEAIYRYANDANASIRYGAMDALAKLHSPAAAHALEQAFADSDSEVRKRALENLMTADKPRGLRLLLSGLRDGDSWIREEAVTQLNGLIGRPGSGADKQIAPMLMAAVTDTDENVSASAVHALCKLTGKNWRFSVLDANDKRGPVLARWRQWWQSAGQAWPAAPQLRDVPPQLPTRADPAPEFEVKDTAGKTFGSDDFKGKITLINFWGTWCSGCKVEVPLLVKIDETYRSRNVAVVGLTIADTSEAGVIAWCRANGVKYRQAMSTSEARGAFGVEDVPVSFLIDSQGRIRYQWDGNRDYGTFQAAIERLLREAAKTKDEG